MKPAKDGKKLWKRVTIKVIVGDKTMHHQFVAPAQRGYSESDIEETLERVIEYLDQKFPVLEFKQVKLSENAFNFIAVGPRIGAQNEGRTDRVGEDVSSSNGSVREAGPPNRSVAAGK